MIDGDDDAVEDNLINLLPHHRRLHPLRGDDDWL